MVLDVRVPSRIRGDGKVQQLTLNRIFFDFLCLEFNTVVPGIGTQTGRDAVLNGKPHIQQYLEFRSEFMGYLYAITRDVDLSEEVYQNAAVVVMEQAGKSEAIRDFRAWAKEVVRRQALHAIREREKSSKRARAVSPELLDVVSNAFQQDETSSSAVNSEFAALKDCLSDLPAEKRRLVTLRYEAGASFDSISSQVESTPAAIQRALSRVRKILHRCIQKKIRTAEGMK